MDFVLTMIGRLEDEKHSQVLKEVLSLTNRYQPILTVNVINKLSALESDTASTASMRAYIQELRNDFNNKYLPNVIYWEDRIMKHIVWSLTSFTIKHSAKYIYRKCLLINKPCSSFAVRQKLGFIIIIFFYFSRKWEKNPGK